MRGKTLKFGFLLAALAAALVVAGTSAGGHKAGKAGGTLVFGAASDPVVLDGALVSDGESIRPIFQMFEGLVGLKPGSTEIVPLLATSWKASKNGLAWTFNLRKGVKFHDGTPFNAAAVCSNFDRWFSFKGSFQNPDATFYWQTIFGGFRNPEPDSPKESLYRGCKIVNDSTVRILLTKRSSSFLAGLSLPAFSIASPTALKKFGADQGQVDSSGVFRPTGTYGTQHPTGTGPFKFESWKVGDKLVLAANDNYWGPKAKLGKLIFRPIPDNAARLQALQTGEIQGYDLVAPEDVPTIKGNKGLQLLNRPSFNVGYVGINSSIPPMDKLAVRQALAYGLDRAAVVKSFYAGRGVVADQFLPTQLFGFAKTGVPQYPFNPAKAKQLLQSAGLTLPVKIDFWWPTSVSRPYMPDPKRNFEAFAASLEKSGFQVTAHSAPWRPDYLSVAQTGKAQVYLLGWTGDYGDPDNFLGVHFKAFNPQFGFRNAKLMNLLEQADAETDLVKRTKLYEDASRLVMKVLPMVPYVHSSPALAFRGNVKGYVPSPISIEPFAGVSLG